MKVLCLNAEMTFHSPVFCTASSNLLSDIADSSSYMEPRGLPVVSQSHWELVCNADRTPAFCWCKRAAYVKAFTFGGVVGLAPLFAIRLSAPLWPTALTSLKSWENGAALARSGQR